MKLTCVTAVFNAIKSGNRENLIRCVRSVATLKTEHEHLIYDGGSTDGTVELLRELEREYGKCLNVGIGECLNEGESGKCLNVGIGECLNEGESSSEESKFKRGMSNYYASTCTSNFNSTNSNIQTFSNSNISSSINLQPQHSLRVVSEPDTGIYNALNKGVRDAQGEWFYVLGCDDYIAKPDVMDELITDAGDAVDVIATSVPVEGDDHPYTIFTNIKKLHCLFDGCVCCHQGEIARTSLVRKLGGFDEQYRIGADTDMFLKARLIGARFDYVMRDFAVFRAGGTAQSNMAESRKDDVNIVAKALKLTDQQRQSFAERRTLPLGVLLELLGHKDMAVRMAARTGLWRIFKWYMRIFLYPLVVATRPLRHGGKLR